MRAPQHGACAMAGITMLRRPTDTNNTRAARLAHGLATRWELRYLSLRCVVCCVYVGGSSASGTLGM